MRRGLTLLITLALAFLSLAPSPTQAVPIYVTCLAAGGTTPGYFQIENNLVIGSSGCTGQAIIPEGVTEIEAGAFNTAMDLTSVTLPKSLNLIGDDAFANSTSLASIYFLGNSAPVVGAGSFANIAVGAKAYKKLAATGFAGVGSPWNNLIVDVGVFTASYNSTGGSPVIVDTFIAGGTIDLAPMSPIRDGYTFDTWSDITGLTTITFPYKPLVADNITLYATWIANNYTVSYNYNFATGGNLIADARFTTGETAIELPTPTRSGYTFGGWYSNAELTSKIGNGGASYSPTGMNLSLSAYAKWTKNVKASARVKPAISGKPKLTKRGTNKLTAKSVWWGVPTPSVTYQWYSCTAKVTSVKVKIPRTCKKISGATKSTLALTKKYKGKHIAVAVTGKSSGSPAMKLLSKTTARVK